MNITEDVLKKYGLIKTEKNTSVFRDDYLMNINSKYDYFLQAILSVPKKDWDNLEYNFSILTVHRVYNYEEWREKGDFYDFKVVYEGKIDTEEDLEFILTKTCVK